MTSTEQSALHEIAPNLIIFAALMLVDIDAFRLAMDWLSAIGLLSIGWAMRWLWADYGLAMDRPWADYGLPIAEMLLNEGEKNPINS